MIPTSIQTDSHYNLGSQKPPHGPNLVSSWTISHTSPTYSDSFRPWQHIGIPGYTLRGRAIRYAISPRKLAQMEGFRRMIKIHQ